MHPVWSDIFGNAQPTEVEIGPGTGTFLLAAAAARPDVNFFSIEHSHSRARRLQAGLDERRLSNVRLVAADAACLLATLLPAESVAAYHIYFPDPWWKRRHHRRRLFTPAFALTLGRTLVPGGRVYVATDVDDVFALIQETLHATRAFVVEPSLASPRTTTTAFERKGLARGAAIRQATYVKRADAYVSKAAPITPAESPS